MLDQLPGLPLAFLYRKLSATSHPPDSPTVAVEVQPCTQENPGGGSGGETLDDRSATKSDGLPHAWISPVASPLSSGVVVHESLPLRLL